MLVMCMHFYLYFRVSLRYLLYLYDLLKISTYFFLCWLLALSLLLNAEESHLPRYKFKMRKTGSINYFDVNCSTVFHPANMCVSVSQPIAIGVREINFRARGIINYQIHMLPFYYYILIQHQIKLARSRQVWYDAAASNSQLPPPAHPSVDTNNATITPCPMNLTLNTPRYT